MRPGHDSEPNLGDKIDEVLYRWDELRRRPVVVAVALVGVLVLAILAVWLRRLDDVPRPVDGEIPQVALEPTTASTAPPASLLVHVVGAVRTPGVYSLPPGSRVLDAVDAAGGATDDGQPNRLNLAATLIDGEQVRVPVDGEPIAGPVRPGGASGPIDLNSATASDLETLPGIGPATAAAIVDHREATGRFQQVADLLDVRGIGEAKLAAIADQVVVR